MRQYDLGRGITGVVTKRTGSVEAQVRHRRAAFGLVVGRRGVGVQSIIRALGLRLESATTLGRAK